MVKNAAAAARAKERKERKKLELDIKTSTKACEDGRALLEPERGQPQYKGAVDLFNEAIEVYSANADAFTYRATAFFEQKQPEQAIEDYTKALSLNPQSVMALEGRASCYESLRQWDKAIVDYTTTTGIQPENDHAFNMRGCCRLRKRAQGLRLKNAEFAAVVDDFTTALRLNENNFHAFTNLGKCYEEHSMFRKAIDNYTKALNIKDDYQYTMFRRGCAALSLVEEEKEKETINAKDLEKLSVDEQIALEEETDKIAKDHKDVLKLAVQDFTKVIGEENKEKEPTALVYRGTCQFLLRDFAKAEEDYNMVRKAIGTAENPGYAEGIPLLDVLDIKTKQLQEEMANIKK